MTNKHRYDFFGASPGKNSVTEEKLTFPLQELWKIGGLLVDTELLVDDSKVIAVSRGVVRKLMLDSKIAAFDRNNGALGWEISMHEKYKGYWAGITCLCRDILITGIMGADSSIFALKKGTEIWRVEQYKMARVVGHCDDEIILSAIDGICFLDPNTGDLIRRYEMNRANSATFNEDVVVAWSQDDHVLNCFDRKSGDLLWSTVFAEMEKLKGLIFGSIACRAPVLIDNRIYTAAGDRIICFDLNNGKMIWRNDSVNLQEVLYRNGQLHGIDTNGYSCLDAATGEVINKKTFLDQTYGKSLPYMVGKYLFCTGPRLVAIDTDTGEEVWVRSDKRESHQFIGQPIFLDGCLYTADNKGNLYCFGT